MTDDIVTRLRASIDGDYFGSREDMKEAADEIERLRVEVNLWMGSAERFAESETAQGHHDAIEFYRKARRSEKH